jgi:hypothetical protein
MTVLSMLAAVATVAAPNHESASASAEARACLCRAGWLTVALALGPGLLALALATTRAAAEKTTVSTIPHNLQAFGPSNSSYRLVLVVLLMATIVAEGAVISAVSLALFVWTKRRDRAIALGAGLFWVAAVGWPLILWHSGRLDLSHGLSMLNFLAVTVSLAAELVTREPQVPGLFAWAVFRIVFLNLVTIGLLWRTMRTLDRRAAGTQALDDPVEFGSADQPARESLSSADLGLTPIDWTSRSRSRVTLTSSAHLAFDGILGLTEGAAE